MNNNYQVTAQQLVFLLLIVNSNRGSWTFDIENVDEKKYTGKAVYCYYINKLILIKFCILYF